jgi:hypothetical protein
MGHGRAGVYLVAVPAADPATWFVNEPVTYKKCAACPKRVVASDQTCMDREWVPARESYWAGSGWGMRRVEISPGPHAAGTYACPDCRPEGTGPARRKEEPAGQTATTPAIPPDGPVAHAAAASGQPEAGEQAIGGAGHEKDHAYAAIHEATARLAGVCDYAETQDGHGFNATDTWLGHMLAVTPARSWTGDEALAAWDMLRKYRGQLDSFGIGYDDLPRPPGAGDPEATRREEARERVRQRARQRREQEYRKARSHGAQPAPSAPPGDHRAEPAGYRRSAGRSTSSGTSNYSTGSLTGGLV